MSPKTKKIIFPVVTILAGVLVLVVLTSLRPEPQKVPKKAIVPLVKFEVVEELTDRIVVRANGTTQPSREVSMIPQVTGEIVSVSPQMKAGGFFKTGDVLFQLDTTDYSLLVNTALAEVAQREVQLEIEQEEALVAKKEWEMYKKEGAGEALKLLLREPQLKLAEANLKAARARLEIARTNLRRTAIRAPFNGRVRKKMADLGQYVAPGTVMATIFNTDRVEITVPLKPEDLQWINLPLKYSSGANPAATVTGGFAGKTSKWKGYLDRIEGELDAKNRLVNAIVIIPNPYGYDTPLLNGMFVDVEIAGKAVESVYMVPGYAVRAEDKVWIVRDGKLEIRSINIVRIDGPDVYTDQGVSAGEKVITSALSVVVDGMPVREEAASDE